MDTQKKASYDSLFEEAIVIEEFTDHIKGQSSRCGFRPHASRSGESHVNGVITHLSTCCICRSLSFP
jgi:hypothetical protein